MTSKTLFKNMYKYESKRNFWLFGVSLFIALLCLPFSFINKMMSLSNNYASSFHNVVLAHPEEVNYQINYFAYYNVLLWVYLGAFAVLNGIFLFSFLHSKEKQDFYFGQPVPKKTLFWSNFLQGIVNVIVPYFACLLITFLAAAVLGQCSGAFVLMMIQTFCVNILFYLSVYSVTVIATILTGNLIYAIMGTGVLLGYFPAFILITMMMFDGNLPNILYVEQVLSYGSPLTLLIEVYGNILDGGYNYYVGTLKVSSLNGAPIVAFLIWTVVMSAVAFYLYGKRKTEGAGKPIAFEIGKKVIKGFLALLAALTCAFIFPELFQSENIIYSIIGLIIGIILGLYVLDVLMDLNFKSFFKNWKKQIAYVVMIGVVFGGIQAYADQYRYDGFTNIPKDYTKEQAIDDGCLVLDETDEPVYDPVNDVVWDSFYATVQSGEDAKIRIANYYGTEADYMDIVFENGEYNVYYSYSKFAHETYKYLYILTGTSEHRDNEDIEICFLTNTKDVSFSFVDDYLCGYLNWNDEEVQNFRSEVIYER